MSAVSEEIVSTIKKLQQLESLSLFSLGGGTNLALRFQHRISIDIDLFTDCIIGESGFKSIQLEMSTAFKKDLISFEFPCNIDDQYIFARCLINCNKTIIKIELLQNMKTIHEIELKDDIKLISKKDIGLFKLVSASNRAAKKDVYDLDYITDEVPLIELYEGLKIKVEKYNTESDQTIFDLDKEKCPISNPQLLLRFDEGIDMMASRPMHSDDSIQNFKGKTWFEARYSWRTKVRELFKHLNVPFPSPQSINI